MKRIYTLILALALLMTAACAPAAAPSGSESMAETADFDPNQEVTLTYYNYNLAYAGIGQEGTQQIIDEFMELYPNITIEGVPVPAPEMMSRTQADFAAGNPPDIAQLIFDDLDFIVTNFNAKPMEDLAPGEFEEHIAGMNPKGVALGQLNGKTYGLAYTFSTPVLFYNADLFREAGLDPDVPPTTWDEVSEMSLQIVENTEADGIFPALYGTFDWMLQGLIKSNGGEVLSEDRTQILFGEPEAIEAIQMLRDLLESGAHTAMASSEAGTAFTEGGLGMYLNTSAIQQRLITASTDKFELRAAKMPAFGDKTPAPTNSGSALFVLSDDPAKQAAAWEFMKFATSKRGYTIITSMIGYLPLRPEIVNEEEYLKDWADENPLVFPNLEQLENLEQWESYPGGNYKQIVNILMGALDEAVYGDGNVETIMQEAAARAQELMPQ